MPKRIDKVFIVDANAFLRFLLNDIPAQKEEFEKILNRAKKSEIKLIVPQIVIFEINFILQKYYGFDKEDIVDKLQTIVETPYLQVVDADIFREVFKLYLESNSSLVDCFIVCFAKKSNVQIFSFDKDLLKLRGK